MKPAIILTACLVLLIGLQTVQSKSLDTIQRHQVPNELKKILSNKISFPEAAAEANVEGIVTTCFMITPEGKIKISCMNGHPLLVAYVQQKMESMDCCPSALAMANKELYIKFNFKKQKA